MFAKATQAGTLTVIRRVALPPHQAGGFDHGDVHLPSGRVFVAHTANDTVDVIDGEQLRLEQTLPDCPEGSGVLCAHGATELVFAAARSAGSVLVIDPRTLRVLRRASVGPKPNGLAWDTDRRRLLVADVETYDARLIDPQSGACLLVRELPGRPRWCVHDPPRRRFLVNVRDPACVVALSADDLAQLARIDGLPAGPHGLDLDRVRNRAFVACDACAVTVLDLSTDQEIARIPIYGEPDAIWYSAATDRLYIAVGDPGLIQVVDGKRWTIVDELSTEKGAHTTAFDSRRSRLYVFLPTSCQALVCARLKPSVVAGTGLRSETGGPPLLLNALRRLWLPAGATSDAGVLVTARGVRAFADGFVSILLPAYLLTLGFNAFQIGAVATTTLIGSAALTLVVGLIAHRYRSRQLLTSAAVLMVATGAGFVLVHDYWPLLVVAFVGTLNPSSGDVSVFLPLEQSSLTATVSAKERTSLFARYSLVGSLLGATGALCAGLPDLIAARGGFDMTQSLQGMFAIYGILGLIALLLYRRLSPALEEEHPQRAPLRESRRIVYTLAALFSLDSLGSGFAVQSQLALWLFEPFDLAVATAGTIFFWTGVFSAASYLVAARLANRIGLVNTMVFTHLPSNVLLILAPFMPDLPLAIALLLARYALSQMDVPPRNSYVMAIVPPAERPAAASVTAVPRTVAAAMSPLASGYLLAMSTFGWPLVISGTIKGIYDLLLLAMFARVPPPEEAEARR